MYMLLKIVWHINYYIDDKLVNQYFSQIGKCDWFYECFILAMWKGCRKLTNWVEMNVLCIVDQDHQWWVIAVEHTSKFQAT